MPESGGFSRSMTRDKTLMAVLSEMSDPVMACDESGKVSLFSMGAEKLTGFRASEILGEQAGLLFVSCSSSGHPAGIGDPRVAAELGGMDCVPVNRTVLIKRKDGLIVPVKMCARALQHEDGWGWMFRIDVADQAIARLPGKGGDGLDDGVFRRLVMAVSDYAILLIDVKGVVQSWNDGAERLFGFTEAEMIGERVDRLHPKEMRDEGKLDQAMRHARAYGRFELDGDRITKSGEALPIFGIMNSIRDCDGKCCGFSCVLQQKPG
ncbi:MAG: hypothetical protein Alpg2KO_25480 [Alphaproteobacteria bacterium]